MVKILQAATGACSYRRLPVPRYWNPVDRPHVAILESMDGRFLRFYVSQPPTEGNELSVKNLEWVRDRTMVEVRHSSTDYRYYRRDGNAWTVVAQARDRFFVECYEDGSSSGAIKMLDICDSSSD
ncbi:MAG: hypothetical protein C4K47_06560 [Candidatus Thorarchaeota archaeon]|nr:MAG: hypothetical protein C4K47_06560 [Candidatus Thorarchaeota archaeon]